MKKRMLISLLVLMLALNFASAGFQLGNASHYIENQYGASENIRGWINISFSEEPASSVFSDSFGNSISVLELLKKNQTYSYSCTTKDCSSDYSANNGTTIKNFDLGVGDSKLVGIKFNEEITAINSINFTLESNAEQSCFNQIKIDLLNDGKTEFGNSKKTIGDCSFLKDYGCFSSEQTTKEYIIGKFPSKHCQKINLSEAPGFKIGAWIKNGNDTRNITAGIYNKYGEPIEGANCILPNANEGETSCEVDYLVTEPGEHYVCIYSEKEGSSKVRGYNLSKGCGFYGVELLNENAAFQIFVEAMKFNDTGTILITNLLKNGDTAGGQAEDYLFKKYGSFNCASGCIIPIRLYSQKGQEITLKDLNVRYETNLGSATTNKFYEIEDLPAKINSGFQKLYVDKGEFLIPAKYGNATFRLNFNGEKILSENIVIEKVPAIVYITPTKTASAFPTIFTAKIESSSNITKYFWEFGDGKSEISSENKITHTYNSSGEYQLKLTVTDSSQKTSYKIFSIAIESPEKIINTTLKKMQANLENINVQIKALSPFHQKSLSETLSLESMEGKLKQVQRDYTSAIYEGDYNMVMTNLLEIKIPEQITASKKAKNIPFFLSEESVDLEILKSVGGGDYDADKKDKYTEAIFLWNQENIESNLNFVEYSSKFEDYDEPAMKIFELTIKKKSPEAKDAYAIIKKVSDLKFKENYLEEEFSGYFSINLEDAEKTIVFSTTEDVDFVSLPVFISPRIENLKLIEPPSSLETVKRWGLLTLMLVSLFIVGFVIYLILQEWYRKRYEDYLFKNRNDLYNLVNYIQTSRKNGVEDSKISFKLKKAGWSSEKVNYAMRKYSGKRTGMLEIPILKFFGLFKETTQYNPLQSKGINKIPRS